MGGGLLIRRRFHKASGKGARGSRARRRGDVISSPDRFDLNKRSHGKRVMMTSFR